ncbi:MAG: 4Fe-4S binding protein [Methanoregulaceae archaeon]|jgi:ferredoxin|nr:4Fe-4S binding protein [Methanoregulaceae archaeon]
MTAIVDKEKCTGCETCIDECPAVAIALNDGKAKVDKDLCVDCETCIDVCPSEAITME